LGWPLLLLLLLLWRLQQLQLLILHCCRHLNRPLWQL